MPLDSEMRGMLEQIIEIQTNGIQDVVNQYRNERKEWGIQNPDEFMYGFLIGSILAESAGRFGLNRGRGVTVDEFEEIKRVIKSRIPQIKEAIFKAG